MNSARPLATLAAILVVTAACTDAVQPLTPAVDAPLLSQSAGSTISYGVAYDGAAYDAATASTTFTYQVASGAKPAISHWMLLYSAATTPAGATSNESAFVVGLDGSTSGKQGAAPQHYGLKFDTGYGDGERRTVTLTLPGAWSVGEVPILVKAGDGYVLGKTTGPVAPAVAAAPTYTVSGVVFYDINGDGAQDADEPGLAGVAVSRSGGAETTTNAAGIYAFTQVPAGTYTVHAAPVTGLTAATAPRTVQVSADVPGADFRSILRLADFCGQAANGFTIGYWKNNIEKNLQGRKGTQVTLAALQGYQAQLAGFALAPLNHAELAQSLTVLSANGSDARAQLLKQLQASEFNYASRAYLGGSEPATRYFLQYGEYLAKNSDRYSAAELLAAKDWFDAYNNTHGGALTGAGCPM